MSVVQAMRGSWDDWVDTTSVSAGSLVSFAGWAADEALRPAAAIRVWVDGSVWATVTPDVLRPDVNASFQGSGVTLDPDTRFGWQVWLDSRGLAPDVPHAVRLEAMSVTGDFLDLGTALVELDPSSRRTIVGPTAPSIHLDRPQVGEDLEEDTVLVAGWINLMGEDLDDVRIMVGGQDVGAARCFTPRRDVADVGGAELFFSGFEFYLHADRTKAHDEDVWAVARLRSGYEVRSERRRVHFGAYPPAQERPELGFERPAGRGAERADGRGAERADGPGSKGLRVLVATHSLSIGGGQLWLSELLDNLMHDDDLCLSVVSTHDGLLRDDLAKAGVPVHLTRNLPDGNAEMYECRIQELATLFEAGRFDVLLCNTVGTFFIADAARRAGIPSIIAIHEHFPLTEWWPYKNDQISGGYAFECMNDTLRSAHRLVFEADATRELYRSMLGHDNGVTVHYGVDITAIDEYRDRVGKDAVRRALGAEPDDVVVINVGTFEPRKSQAALIESFDRVASRHPEATLWLVGAADDPYSNAVLDMLDRRSPHAPRIRVIPIDRDIWKYYLAADLIISASDIESMPRSFMEAIAFRVPIVTTDVAGCKELVSDGISGWTTPVRTTAGLEMALERAMLDRDRWADFAQAGRALLEERHSSARHALEINALLREAAAAAGPAHAAVDATAAAARQ